MQTFIYAFQVSPCPEVIVVVFLLDLHRNEYLYYWSYGNEYGAACHMGMNISTASRLGMSHHVSCWNDFYVASSSFIRTPPKLL